MSKVRPVGAGCGQMSTERTSRPARDGDPHTAAVPTGPVPMGEPERCSICGRTFDPGAIREYFSTPDAWAIHQEWGPVHTTCRAALTIRDELDLLQSRGRTVAERDGETPGDERLTAIAYRAGIGLSDAMDELERAAAQDTLDAVKIARALRDEVARLRARSEESE